MFFGSTENVSGVILLIESYVLPFVSFPSNRDVRYRDPVLLLLPALPGDAQLYHLSAHVQLRHVAHHHCAVCFCKYHLQPE